MLAWCENGQFAGSVSGGCIEDDLLREFAQKMPDNVEVKEYGVSREQAESRGLPCGGRLKIVIEPLTQADDSARLLSTVAKQGSIKRSLHLASGAVSHEEAAVGTQIALTDEYFHNVFEADWRLLIIGAGELAQFVDQFARALGFATLVCDPRENYRESWPHPQTSVDGAMPDDFIEASQCDERTAIVALTHDPKIDDMAILTALESQAFYVGALGSRRTTAAREKRLREHFDVSEQSLAALHGPIGVDLNTRNAAEIALGVITEIVATRNGVSLRSERKSELDAG